MSVYQDRDPNDVVTLDKGTQIFDKLVLDQYRNSPNFKAYAGAFLAEFDYLFEQIERVYLGRMLEYATGELLTFLGRAVDVSRNITIEDSNFGFDEEIGAGTFGTSGNGVTVTPTSPVLSGFDLDISASATVPVGVFFKPNGRVVYFIDNSSNKVYQQELNFAWRLDTAKALVESFSIGAQDNNAQELFFDPTGTKMYFAGSTNDKVYQYTLSVPWDIKSAIYDDFLLVSGSATTPSTFVISEDGMMLFVGDYGTKRVSKFDLSTPWDVSTGIVDPTSFIIPDITNTLRSIKISPDGLALLAINASGKIVKYDLSVPWDLGTAVYSGDTFTTSSASGSFMKPGGTELFLITLTDDEIFHLQLPAAWEVLSSIEVPNVPIVNSVGSIFRSLNAISLQLGDSTFRRAVRAKALCNGAEFQNADFMYEVITILLGRVPSVFQLRVDEKIPWRDIFGFSQDVEADTFGTIGDVALGGAFVSLGVGFEYTPIFYNRVILTLEEVETTSEILSLIYYMRRYFLPSGYQLAFNLI